MADERESLQGCQGSTELPGSIRLEWRCVLREPEARVSASLRSGESQECFVKEPTPSLMRLAQGTILLTFRIVTHQKDGQPVARLSVEVQRGGVCGPVTPVAEWSLAPPEPEARDRTAGFAIEPVRGEGDLFSLTWTHPPRPVDREATERRFIHCPDPERLPLYDELVALSQEPEARARMIAAGLDFQQDPEQYVTRLADLPPPADRYPRLLARVGALQGIAEPDELVQIACDTLDVDDLNAYVESDAYRETGDRLWQSVLAFALSPGASRPGAVQIEGLRAFRLIESIDRRDPRLRTEEGRHAALLATAALPEGVAPPPARGEEDGFARLLGVGEQQVVRQRLLCYQPGDIAGTVNVLRRERQERRQRSLTRTSEASGSAEEREQGSAHEGEHAQRSELRAELRDVLCAGSLCRDYDGLKVTYGTADPDLTVSGTVKGRDCGAERGDARTSGFAEDVVARAALRMADRAAEWRARSLLTEREDLERRIFDNATEKTDLVGVYRWLRQILQLHADNVGRRLVLELVVGDPAAAYLRDVEGAGEPLTPPPPLPISGWREVTPENYRALAATYDVTDQVTPPPPEQRVVTAALQSAPPTFKAELTVPEGYRAASATVSYLVSDARCVLVGYLGTVTFMTTPPALVARTAGAPPPPAAAAPPTPAAAGQSAPAAQDTGGCPDCVPPAPPTPASGTLDLGGVDASERRFRAAVLTAASGFSIDIVITTTAVDLPGQLEAWKIRTWHAISGGYDAALGAYRAALAERVRKSSAGRACEVQRRALEQRGMDVLWARHSVEPMPEPAYLRFFDQALEFSEMTWSYEPWGAGTPGGARLRWAGERLLFAECEPLFASFLSAGSARILVTVRPGFELVMLFYLLYGQIWPSGEGTAPVASASIPLLLDLDAPAPPPPPPWTVDLPTPYMVLQDGAFPCKDCP